MTTEIQRGQVTLCISLFAKMLLKWGLINCVSGFYLISGTIQSH